MTIPALHLLAIALLCFLVLEGCKSIARRHVEPGALKKIAFVALLNLIAAFGAFGGLHYFRENWLTILLATVLGTLATVGLHHVWCEARTRRAF